MSQVTFAERIKQAPDLQSALLVLAEAADAILEARETPATSGWGAWGGDQGWSKATSESPAPTPQEDFYAKVEAPLDVEAIAAAQAAVERYQQLVDRSPTPANLALLHQAQSVLAKVEKPDPRYGILNHSGDVEGEAFETDDAEEGFVDLSRFRGDEKLWGQRRQLAEAIDLPGFFPPLMRENPTLREDILEAYSKGGPMWLYHNRVIGDHDIMPQLPPAALAVMVADIAQFSTRAAWEFQRDVMKTEDVEGAGLAIAQDNIDSQIQRGGIPLLAGD